MPELTALQKIKLRIPVEGQDDILSLFLADAEDMILDYIGRDTLPTRLVSVQVELAVIEYNRQGTEGSTSRSEGGVSESYIDGLPDDMKQRLKNYPRKVGVLRCESSQDDS